MRNLTEHPITLHEIEKCLEQLADEIDRYQSIGDMRPLLLKTAANIIRRVEFATHIPYLQIGGYPRGREGGKARAEKLSPARRTEIASAAAQKRWKSEPS